MLWHSRAPANTRDRTRPCAHGHWPLHSPAGRPHTQVLAEALLGFIDVDRNGKIDGGELKVRALHGGQRQSQPVGAPHPHPPPRVVAAGGVVGASGLANLACRPAAPQFEARAGVMQDVRATRLQVMLAILGFPAALVLPIPKGVGIDYRAVLGAFNGGGDKK